jgi:hypothetical protein
MKIIKSGIFAGLTINEATEIRNIAAKQLISDFKETYELNEASEVALAEVEQFFNDKSVISEASYYNTKSFRRAVGAFMLNEASFWDSDFVQDVGDLSHYNDIKKGLTRGGEKALEYFGFDDKPTMVGAGAKEAGKDAAQGVLQSLKDLAEKGNESAGKLLRELGQKFQDLGPVAQVGIPLAAAGIGAGILGFLGMAVVKKLLTEPNAKKVVEAVFKGKIDKSILVIHMKNIRSPRYNRAVLANIAKLTKLPLIKANKKAVEMLTFLYSAKSAVAITSAVEAAIKIGKKFDLDEKTLEDIRSEAFDSAKEKLDKFGESLEYNSNKLEKLSRIKNDIDRMFIQRNNALSEDVKYSINGTINKLVAEYRKVEVDATYVDISEGSCASKKPKLNSAMYKSEKISKKKLNAEDDEMMDDEDEEPKKKSKKSKKSSKKDDMEETEDIEDVEDMESSEEDDEEVEDIKGKAKKKKEYTEADEFQSAKVKCKSCSTMNSYKVKAGKSYKAKCKKCGTMNSCKTK